MWYYRSKMHWAVVFYKGIRLERKQLLNTPKKKESWFCWIAFAQKHLLVHGFQTLAEQNTCKHMHKQQCLKPSQGRRERHLSRALLPLKLNAFGLRRSWMRARQGRVDNMKSGEWQERWTALAICTWDALLISFAWFYKNRSCWSRMGSRFK